MIGVDVGDDIVDIAVVKPVDERSGRFGGESVRRARVGDPR
jgi:hypothetical protein